MHWLYMVYIVALQLAVHTRIVSTNWLYIVDRLVVVGALAVHTSSQYKIIYTTGTGIPPTLAVLLVKENSDSSWKELE
ncbi:hypothetical protein FB451DRAFT_1207014 [Mycena latifolia]|nr:hypothetical protein FB451DRAFT_1207014 [Mycena latifolia]